MTNTVATIGMRCFGVVAMLDQQPLAAARADTTSMTSALPELHILAVAILAVALFRERFQFFE